MIERYAKTILFLAFCLFLILPASQIRAQAAPSPVFKDAIEYNDFVINEQNVIGSKILVLITIIQDPTATKEQANEALADAVRTSQKAVEGMGNVTPYEGGERFHKAATELFSFYNSMFRNEYKEVVDLVFSEEITAEDEVRMGELVEIISNKEAGFDQEFSGAQNEFAQRHNFTLRKNELQDQFDDN